MNALIDWPTRSSKYTQYEWIQWVEKLISILIFNHTNPSTRHYYWNMHIKTANLAVKTTCIYSFTYTFTARNIRCQNRHQQSIVNFHFLPPNNFRWSQIQHFLANVHYIYLFYPSIIDLNIKILGFQRLWLDTVYFPLKM